MQLPSLWFKLWEILTSKTYTFNRTRFKHEQRQFVAMLKETADDGNQILQLFLGALYCQHSPSWINSELRSGVALKPCVRTSMAYLKRACGGDKPHYAEIARQELQRAQTENANIVGAGLFTPKRQPYPAALKRHFSQRKVTGPRVACALRNIAQREGEAHALSVGEDFSAWAAQHNRNFNLQEVDRLLRTWRQHIQLGDRFSVFHR